MIIGTNFNQNNTSDLLSNSLQTEAKSLIMSEQNGSFKNQQLKAVQQRIFRQNSILQKTFFQIKPPTKLVSSQVKPDGLTNMISAKDYDYHIPSSEKLDYQPESIYYDPYQNFLKPSKQDAKKPLERFIKYKPMEENLCSPSAMNSPFISPQQQKVQRRPTAVVSEDVHFGYQEYEFSRLNGTTEYTTIYFFKVENKKHSQSASQERNNFYHEIVTQSPLKKFYFTIMLKKLIGYLCSCTSVTNYNIYCNDAYYERLLQVTLKSYSPESFHAKKSFENLFQVRQKFLLSNLKFNIQKASSEQISNKYLSEKKFPSNYCSIRIPNSYSNSNSEDFLNEPKFNNYLSSELHELYQDQEQCLEEIIKFQGQLQQRSENDQNTTEIIPFYDDETPSIEEEEAECERYDEIKSSFNYSINPDRDFNRIKYHPTLPDSPNRQALPDLSPYNPDSQESDCKGLRDRSRERSPLKFK